MEIDVDNSISSEPGDGVFNTVNQLQVEALASVKAHRVLFVPEVFDNVMCFSDDDATAKCTRVCRSWKDIAKGHTWRTLDDIMPLLWLLAPLETRSLNDKSLFFSRGITFVDWANFASYASSVRELNFWARGSEYESLSDHALLDLCLSRKQNEALLPNLTCLTIRTPLSPKVLGPFMRLILSKAIYNLQIFGTCEANSGNDMTSLISDASWLCPHIRYFRIWNDNWTMPFSAQMEDALGAAIAKCNILNYRTEIQTLTSKRLMTLASLKNLQDIHLYWEEEYLALDNIPLPHLFESPSGRNAFPVLTNLCLRLCVKGIENIFSNTNTYLALRQLEIHVVLNSDREELKQCLRRISSSCPELRKFYLVRHDNLSRQSTTSARAEVPHRSTLTSGFKCLGPLCKFTDLQALSVDHHWPLVFDNKQLLEFLRSFPRLKTLHLNPEPIGKSSNTHTTLAVLPGLASILPDLTELHLFVDANNGAFGNLIPVSQGFLNLTVLSFGTSPLPVNHKDWGPILVLLGQLVTSRCQIKTAPYLKNFRIPEEDKEIFINRRREWEIFSGLLQAAIQVRSLAVSSIQEGKSRPTDW